MMLEPLTDREMLLIVITVLSVSFSLIDAVILSKCRKLLDTVIEHNEALIRSIYEDDDQQDVEE